MSKHPAGFVRVGVGVLVKDPTKSNKVFAGIRKGSHGAKTLALPGGHLEMNETWEECAKREVLEETGLEIHNLELAHVSNDIMMKEQKHYITIFMTGECVDLKAIAQNLEPHKCEGWASFSWNDLKKISKKMNQKQDVVYNDNEIGGLFIPLQNLVDEEPDAVVKFFQD